MLSPMTLLVFLSGAAGAWIVATGLSWLRWAWWLHELCDVILESVGRTTVIVRLSVVAAATDAENVQHGSNDRSGKLQTLVLVA